MTRLIGDMISDYGPIVLTLAIVLVAMMTAEADELMWTTAPTSLAWN